MSEFAKGITPANPKQTEIDKTICMWLNDKRLGKIGKDVIRNRILAMSQTEADMYQDALRRYGSMFLEK